MHRRLDGRRAEIRTVHPSFADSVVQCCLRPVHRGHARTSAPRTLVAPKATCDSMQASSSTVEQPPQLSAPLSFEDRHGVRDQSGRVLLKNLNQEELEEWCTAVGEPPKRAKQLLKALYGKGRWVRRLEEMDNDPAMAFSAQFKAKVSAAASLSGGMTLQSVQTARDGTHKLVFSLAEGEGGARGSVETVLIPMTNRSGTNLRYTACLSTQVGCAMNCQFCYTGRMGLQGNLSTAQIVEQVVEARRWLAAQAELATYPGLSQVTPQQQEQEQQQQQQQGRQPPSAAAGGQCSEDGSVTPLPAAALMHKGRGLTQQQEGEQEQQQGGDEAGAEEGEVYGALALLAVPEAELNHQEDQIPPLAASSPAAPGTTGSSSSSSRAAVNLDLVSSCSSSSDPKGAATAAAVGGAAGAAAVGGAAGAAAAAGGGAAPSWPAGTRSPSRTLAKQAKQQAAPLPRPVPISNIVFMGMGEPLDNFDCVMAAIDVLAQGLELARSKIIVSTVGLADRMDEFLSSKKAKLALSLHATTDEVRNWIVPTNRRFPLQRLVTTLEQHFPAHAPSARGDNFVVLEYVLLGGVNDSLADAERLVALTANIYCMVNLIVFNPWEGTTFKKSTDLAVRAFRGVLMAAGRVCTLRVSKGDDEMAACGQLGDPGQGRKRVPIAEPPVAFRQLVAGAVAVSGA